MLDSLPIDAELPRLLAAYRDTHALVLVAEPGAGKTTRVPRELLLQGFADAGEILVLQPRRIACRFAAARVAQDDPTVMRAVPGVTSNPSTVIFSRPMRGRMTACFWRPPRARRTCVASAGN